jgi:hypothetical protein
MVARTYNPSYSKNGSRRIASLRTAQAKLTRPCIKNKSTTAVAQVAEQALGSGFNPDYCSKKIIVLWKMVWQFPKILSTVLP